MGGQIEITREEEEGAGWKFNAQVLEDDGSLTPLTLRLAWADYNLWSRGGSDPPQRVAEGVLRFLLHRSESHQLPANLDASLARRLFRDADEQIPNFITD